MNQLAFIYDDDQLKELIKECLRETLAEYFPYPSSRNIDDKKVLTRKQAAAYMEVSPNTLTRYVRQGKLLPAIINGKYKFIESDLINCLNKEKV